MALVFIPGYMADKELWASLEPELEEFGPIVHADIGKDDSIPQMARRVIAEAPERFVLIGFSLGGYVAREIARLVPDKVVARGDLLTRRYGRPSPAKDLGGRVCCSFLQGTQPIVDTGVPASFARLRC
jgi:pimeloyl-ACP methyl ester carboxylesterase